MVERRIIMKRQGLTLAFLSISFMMLACSPKEQAVEHHEKVQAEPVKPDDSRHRTESAPVEIPAIWVKSYRMDTVNKEVCHEASEDDVVACTIYDVQSVKTNIDWINRYYDQQLTEQYPEAFGEKSTFKLEGEDADRKYYAGSMVTFRGQRYNLVTFSRFDNIYLGGAHNMFNTRYDIFNLKTQKKIILNDVINKASRNKLLALIKTYNEAELKEYGTDLNDLKVSENFYLAEHGLVFVYAPYEIAPFVYGIPELYVPYEELKDLIKAEYMPSLPDTSLSQNFS